MPEILSQKIESQKEKLRESIAELIETERTYVARLMTTYKVRLRKIIKYLILLPLDLCCRWSEYTYGK